MGPGQTASFFVGQRSDAVVEAGNEHPPVGVLKVGNDLAQCLSGVGGDPAIQPGMQVAVGRLDAELEVDESSESILDGWHTLGRHPRIADDTSVGSEQAAVRVHEGLEVWATDL